MLGKLGLAAVLAATAASFAVHPYAPADETRAVVDGYTVSEVSLDRRGAALTGLHFRLDRAAARVSVGPTRCVTSGISVTCRFAPAVAQVAAIRAD